MAPTCGSHPVSPALSMAVEGFSLPYGSLLTGHFVGVSLFPSEPCTNSILHIYL